MSILIKKRPITCGLLLPVSTGSHQVMLPSNPPDQRGQPALGRHVLQVCFPPAVSPTALSEGSLLCVAVPFHC